MCYAEKEETTERIELQNQKNIWAQNVKYT